MSVKFYRTRLDVALLQIFFRNFANKLWNAGKFIQNCMAGLDTTQLNSLAVQGPMTATELQALPLPERYIVSRCHEVTARVTQLLESYSFGDAGRLVHDFLWDELADWYIEASKVRMREGAVAQAQTRRVLVYVWDSCMRLLHPFMPYLTETLWQQIPHSGDSIMLSAWPQLAQAQDGHGQGEEQESQLAVDSAAVRDFGLLQALVRSIRNARAEYNVDAGKKIPVILKLQRPALHALLEQERQILSLLARAEDSQLQIVLADEGATINALEAAGPCVHLVVEEGLEAYLPQSGLVDPQKERLRLGKQAERLQKDIAVMQSRLQSSGFVDRAPAHLVAEAKDKLRDMEEQLSVVNNSLFALA